jgi:dTDP-4-dehydrorhamnose reductase
MKVLITGSNGLLGTKLIQNLVNDYELSGFSHNSCMNSYLGKFTFYRGDLANREEVKKVIEIEKPQIIIHGGAMTDVDGCENHYERAYEVNAKGTKYVAQGAKENGAKLIYLSTDYIFDGLKGPYGEEDHPDPLNWYGKTKLWGEHMATFYCSDCIIARTTVVYGFAPHLPLNFATWVVKMLKEERAIKVVTDQIGSPTLADDLAQMLRELIEVQASGIYNTVGADVISRFDFARKIARCFGLREDLIQGVSTEELQQAAPRPLFAGLGTDKFEKAVGRRPMNIEESLAVMRMQMEGI